MKRTRILDIRRLAGMLLIALLAVCAYAGTKERGETVSVAVTRTPYEIAEYDAYDVRTAAEESKKENEKQLELIRRVIESAETDPETRDDAIRQLGGMAERTALETQIYEYLKEMSIEEAAVICGAHMVTVIADQKEFLDEQSRTRVFSAIADISGFEAGDIKIILAKK